jgi:hypothetical protein
MRTENSNPVENNKISLLLFQAIVVTHDYYSTTLKINAYEKTTAIF